MPGTRPGMTVCHDGDGAPQAWLCGRSCRRTRRCCARSFATRSRSLTADDYTEAQQEAWASAADDEKEFGKKLAGELTLVATLEGSPVGFAALEGKDKIDMLYVHPAAAGQGVGAMLIDALEKLAGGRGAAKLMVDASDTRARLLRKARLRRAAAQHRFGRRRVARQHHAAQALTCRQTGGLMSKPDTPFPRHWLYYIILKFAVLAAAVLLALYYFGVI